MEAIPKENALLTAKVDGGTGGYFFVAVGVDIEGTGTITVDPMRAVTLESDSSPHMVFFPIRHPDLRSFKGTVVDKKQLGRHGGQRLERQFRRHSENTSSNRCISGVLRADIRAI